MESICIICFLCSHDENDVLNLLQKLLQQQTVAHSLSAYNLRNKINKFTCKWMRLHLLFYAQFTTRWLRFVWRRTERKKAINESELNVQLAHATSVPATLATLRMLDFEPVNRSRAMPNNN